MHNNVTLPSHQSGNPRITGTAPTPNTGGAVRTPHTELRGDIKAQQSRLQPAVCKRRLWIQQTNAVSMGHKSHSQVFEFCFSCWHTLFKFPEVHAGWMNTFLRCCILFITLACCSFYHLVKCFQTFSQQKQQTRCCIQYSLALKPTYWSLTGHINMSYSAFLLFISLLYLYLLVTYCVCVVYAAQQVFCFLFLASRTYCGVDRWNFKDIFVMCLIFSVWCYLCWPYTGAQLVCLS